MDGRDCIQAETDRPEIRRLDVVTEINVNEQHTHELVRK